MQEYYKQYLRILLFSLFGWLIFNIHKHEPTKVIEISLLTIFFNFDILQEE